MKLPEKRRCTTEPTKDYLRLATIVTELRPEGDDLIRVTIRHHDVCEGQVLRGANALERCDDFRAAR